MSLQELINSRNGAGKCLLCLEVNPPRGVDLEPIFARFASGGLAGIDLVNVTDSALARMKFAALPFAAEFKRRFGLEPLVNLSCRDRNLIAIQGDLLAAWQQNIRSIVALTGDAVSVGDNPERKGVFEVNSVGLLKVIATLNAGTDLVGNKLVGAPSFVSGVVVNPNVKNPAAEVRRLGRKAENGGRYALSQPVFSETEAREFLVQAQVVPLPILLGLLPFKNKAALASMGTVPGIGVPKNLIDQVDDLPDSAVEDFSLDYCLSLAKSLRPLVAGFHVVSGASSKLALKLARKLVSTFKDEVK